jgi:hypothetical protein
MLTVLLLTAWVLFFALLVIVPLLPKVDARPRIVARRDSVEQVVTLAEGRAEHAA